MGGRKEEFEELFEIHQSRLYSYVYAVLRDPDDAQDVFQLTTTILWSKFDQFEAGTQFFNWAATVARFECLKFIDYRRRSRVYFDQDMMEQLAVDAESIDNELVEARRNALSHCLKSLSEADTKLIGNRYEHELGSRQIAEILGRSQASICNSLTRVRDLLMNCIMKKLGEESFS